MGLFVAVTRKMSKISRPRIHPSFVSKHKFGLLALVGVIICTLLFLIYLANSISNEYASFTANQQGYDEGLAQLGIEPSLAGVETYIVQTVTAGVVIDEAKRQLAPLGLIKVHPPNNPNNCGTMEMWLIRNPRGKFSLFGKTPPIYYLDVCFVDSTRQIDSVGELLKSVDGSHPKPID